MTILNIKQSSNHHPGLLTEADVEFLTSDHPLIMGSQQPLILPTSASRDRGDAGSITIVFTFILGQITGGALNEIGKDLYSWVKQRLSPKIKEKIRCTDNNKSSYSYLSPRWEIIIKSNPTEYTGFSGKIEIQSVESLENAISSLTTYLNEESLQWDLNNGRYEWKATETLSGLSIKSYNDTF